MPNGNFFFLAEEYVNFGSRLSTSRGDAVALVTNSFQEFLEATLPEDLELARLVPDAEGELQELGDICNQFLTVAAR